MPSFSVLPCVSNQPQKLVDSSLRWTRMRPHFHSSLLRRCHDDERDEEEHLMDLELELGSSPVTPFGVVTDRVARSHSDPLRDGPILLLLLRQHLFNLQSFVRWHPEPFFFYQN